MAKKMYREASTPIARSCCSIPTTTSREQDGHRQPSVVDLPRAARIYEKASKVNHRYSEAINNLGTIYYAQKDYRRAIRLYEQALEIAPDSASIHSNLGTRCLRARSILKAIVHYQRALALDPKSSSITTLRRPLTGALGAGSRNVRLHPGADLRGRQ